MNSLEGLDLGVAVLDLPLRLGRLVARLLLGRQELVLLVCLDSCTCMWVGVSACVYVGVSSPYPSTPTSILLPPLTLEGLLERLGHLGHVRRGGGGGGHGRLCCW